MGGKGRKKWGERGKNTERREMRWRGRKGVPMQESVQRTLCKSGGTRSKSVGPNGGKYYRKIPWKKRGGAKRTKP